ncbi:hypothetical protein [Nocardioides sp. YIM 152315]|uniref:hypothetical protein n=1 Tax=Nocardioides sp. YIM 152315 TaxID=3031760 RepID=UPI0023DB5A02|nr:hypothetical protein [Nocardioides sp. YIM 152315]MDF1605501.1 hypothetical protein [Nocardioides sp. YIM 152315]
MTREQTAADVFRRAAASIEVTSAPLADVVAVARARRGRRRRIAIAGAAVAVLVVGGGTWLAARSSPESDELARLDVKPAPNPVDVAWYANGRLHLDEISVALPQLTGIVEVDGGAAYVDVDGTVGFVSADGDHRRLGSSDPDTLLVGSTETGWAAWIEPGRARLVVHDVGTGEVVGSRDLASADAQLIAIDQHRVFYREAGDSYAWTPGVESPERLVRRGLVDVESATRLYQEGRRIVMVQSLFSVEFARPGLGGTLSSGGTYVLTRRADGDVAPVGDPYRPLMYDARSGDRIRTGVGPGELAVDAAFGDNNTVTYLVAPAADLDGDPLLVLRSCTLGGDCNDVAPVPTGTDRPLLAH